MRPENSQQHYYLPPALDAPPGQPGAAYHPSAPLQRVGRPQSRFDHYLQQVTCVLVSAAAFVYVSQALLSGLGMMIARLPATPTLSAETEAKKPEAAAPKPPAAQPAAPAPQRP